jgi:hypothetical protein
VFWKNLLPSSSGQKIVYFSAVDSGSRVFQIIGTVLTYKSHGAMAQNTTEKQKSHKANDVYLKNVY